MSSTTIRKQHSPEEGCSLFSKIFLLWLGPLLNSGAITPLTGKDLYPIVASAKSAILQEKWFFYEKGSKEKQKHPESSLGWQIFDSNRRFWYKYVIIRLFTDMLHFVQPMLIKTLIDVVSAPTFTLWNGLLVVITMFAVSELRSLILNYVLYELNILGVLTQSLLRNLIFQKTLRLSSSARNSRSIGEILNLAAVDIDKIFNMILLIHGLFSPPIQMILASFSMWWTLGNAAFSSVLVMLLMIPANSLLSIFLKKHQIKMMKAKDERVKLSREALNGMKVIKMYSWENVFEKKINDLRAQEVRQMRYLAIIFNISHVANAAVLFMMTAATFGTIVYTGEQLTPQKIFVTLALINLVKEPLRVITSVRSTFVQCSVALDRLDSFMALEEKTKKRYPEASDGYSIQLKSLCSSWIENTAPVLSDISLDLPNGALVTIVGTVGAGKTSVLEAILGEMTNTRGEIRVSGSIAYAPQKPWILNMTVRENITFGKPFNSKFYRKVIDACQLQADIEQFQHGDLTEIGENGATLSGGQKARIGLGRAVYSDADVYLLDDILSSVDAHVGQRIFDQVIGKNGLLSKKTRVFVTHGMTYTTSSDQIVIMKDGSIVDTGTYEDLVTRSSLFKQLLTQRADIPCSKEARFDKPNFENGSTSLKNGVPAKSKNLYQQTKAEEEHPLIQEEKLEMAKVDFSVYHSLIKACNPTLLFFFLLFLIIQMFVASATNMSLSKWSVSSNWRNDTMGVNERMVAYYLLGSSEVLVLSIAYIFLVFAAESAALNLHSPLIRTLFRSSMGFFDTIPVGRIVNRLSSDVSLVHFIVTSPLRQLVQCSLQVLLILLIIVQSTPAFVVVLLPILYITTSITSRYLSTSRQLRRMENISKSPLLSIFGECIEGITSIRVFDKHSDVISKFQERVDTCTNCKYLSLAAGRWLAIRLDFVSNLTVFLVALFGIVSARFSTITPGVIGLSVTFASSVTEYLALTVRMISELEAHVVSVERIEEYANHKMLEVNHTSPQELRLEWKEEGDILFSNYCTRYREDLPLVIDNLNLHIKSGEKVAIVGRTGSGKSSLVLSLFRLIEAHSGSITIDGIDISKRSLSELRSRLTIIPQDPTLFSGSLRFNLDPTDEYSDDEIRRVLECCQLMDCDYEEHGLNMRILEGGRNKSVGERQLICLARALLRKGKIVILDEATAAIDTYTDAIIQKVIRENFSEATVISIAHRLNTVNYFDRIVVMDAGRIVEMGSPTILLSRKNSLFSKMVAVHDQ